MKRGQAGWRGARVTLSFAVAASMMLGGLPVPALEVLADEAEVIAEEVPASNEQPAQSGATTEEALAAQDDGEDPFVPDGMTANQELIFTDGPATLSVHLDKIGAPEGTQPELTAGRFYPGGEGNNGLQWGDDLGIEGLLRYDEANSTVIVDGTKLADTDLVANRNVGVYINAIFTWGEGDAQTTKIGGVVLFVDEPFVGHDQENERVMLRGWDGGVDNEYNVYVENAAFPNGEDLRYTVTNVEVATNEPDQAGEEVLAITQKDDGQGWHYEARNFGRAVVRVTYRDPAELGGGTGSYTFDVYVDDVVYDLSIRTSTGSDRLLPGKSVDFEVTGRRKWENPETGERGEDSDGLSYSWDVVSTRGDLGNVPENVASIDQNGRLTALALPDDVHGVWQFVNVRVTMKDAHDPNANTACDFELKICDNYTEVWPPAINSRLIPGKSQTITPEVRNYRVDLANDYEVIPNVTFEASGVDQNAVAVEKNGDGSFTITRLDRYPTDFFITGRWADDEYDDLEKPCRYHLDHIDFGMSFKNGDQERLYPGDSVTLEPEAAEADRDLFDSCELDWSVGVANDRGEFSYDNVTSDDEKVFSVVGNAIVLDGAKCLANDEIRAHGGINVCARAKVGGVELADAWCWVELREARVDYQREEDRDMLRGWGGDVNGDYNVYVENAAFPDGKDLRYTVTNVEVESQKPADGDPVVELKRGDEGNGWHYDARNFGTATIEVTYQDPAELGGGTGSYTFEVHVGNTVHEVDMWSEDGVYRALPGQTITVYAQGVRKQQDEEDKHDGFGYEWSLGDNAQYATLTVDQSDPQRAYVTFNELADDEDGIWKDVQVEVALIENGEEHARTDKWLTVSDDYCVIESDQIDPGLDVGASVTIKPEVHHYRLGVGGYEVVDAGFEWQDYDGNLFGITDNGDGSFTITRLGNWDGQANLRASWKEHGEGRDEWASYRFDHKDYNAWFEWDEDSTATEEGNDEHGHWINPLLYNDWTTTLTLNTEKLATVPDYHMQPELMLKGETGGEEQVVPLEQGYTIDGNTITFDGTTVNQIAQSQQWDKVWGVDVCFRVMYGSGNDAVELCEAHQWVGMRDGCGNHVWSERIVTQPSCEKPGTKKQLCERCDEVRLVPIPAKGHTLDAVAAKPATLTATGTKAHHKCSVCHKLFSDAAGTNEVTAASLTIAKLVNIAGAKVTVASKAYTGKAQTSAPVVKLGGKTLRAGTDYTVTGNQGTNAGSYVVTITGKGAYGGTAKGTFVITKIASAMTVKATKKKVKIADVAKKSQKVSGALTVKNQSGKVTYALNKKTKKAKATKKFKISSKGVVTVPKGTAKGKYSLKINVKDAGDINHAAKTKTVTLVITVK